MEAWDALVGAVGRFVADLGREVTELASSAGTDPSTARNDVSVEAANVVAGFIDADLRHTDTELLAFIAVLGPLIDTELGHATPDDVRRAGLIAGKRVVLERPSELFDLLVAADGRDQGRRSWTYYRRAMELAHAVAALDQHTSQAELHAIARYRAMLLDHIQVHGVGRPDTSFFTDAPIGLVGPDGVADPGVRATATDAPPPAPAAAEPALAPPRPVEELLEELHDLVGLEPVKAEVELVANLLIVQRMRATRGLPTIEGSRHLVFTGNPGTGKTTVARLLAEIYRSLEVVDRGHLVEVDRSALVAGFVGQTATRTKEVVESALDGVLLIDEAHALARGSEQDFGREAIDTLVKLMEDHRDRFVLIVAGYPDEMAAFIAANPGLASRFPKTIHFPDYTTEELVRIIELMAETKHYHLGPGARDRLVEVLDAVPRGKGFGNGRLARNLFEAAIARQATRIVAQRRDPGAPDPTDEELTTLVGADIPGSVT